jgi:putative peptidoglycan lipid II flippase
LNAALLLGVLIKRGHWQSDRGLVTRLPRLILAALIMGAALWYAMGWLGDQLSSQASFITQAGTLALLVGGGAVVYALAAFGLGGADKGVIRRSVKRRS